MRDVTKIGNANHTVTSGMLWCSASKLDSTNDDSFQIIAAVSRL